MLNLFLNRKEYADDCTLGELHIGNAFFCYTLEDKFREDDRPVEEWKIPKATAIPSGVYEVRMQWSNHFNRKMPFLQNVPGFDGIMLHSGNTAEDTEGCILVGYKQVDDSISESHKASDDLNRILQASQDSTERITITINNVVEG